MLFYRFKHIALVAGWCLPHSFNLKSKTNHQSSIIFKYGFSFKSSTIHHRSDGRKMKMALKVCLRQPMETRPNGLQNFAKKATFQPMKAQPNVWACRLPTQNRPTGSSIQWSNHQSIRFKPGFEVSSSSLSNFFYPLQICYLKNFLIKNIRSHLSF